jgi:hypothetical protein
MVWMSRVRRLTFNSGLLILAALLLTSSCRRKRSLPRGETAVVVVKPRHDAASPPRVTEQEPNDKPEQSQLLAINADWPAASVEGGLAGEGKQGDVDVFKLVVPESHMAVAKAMPSPDSGGNESQPPPRRLAIDITAEGSAVSLQVLDEKFKSLPSIVAEAGVPAGIPNLAVFPGHSYYIRLKPAAKVSKPATRTKTPTMAAVEPLVFPKYKLMVQLGDFEPADEREPNDGMDSAEAPVMFGNAELAGFHGWQHDQDFYRIQAPEIPSVLDMDLGAVEGVAASLQVLDGQGGRLAISRGRKSERLSLRNVSVPVGAVDAGIDARFFYVVVRSEAGENRSQRYVLRLTLGAPKLDSEIEPNDNAGNPTLVRDGTTSGFLPVGDVDYFRYVQEAQREITFEITFPTRVRGKLEVIRQNNGQTLGKAEAKKPHQTLLLAKLPSPGWPMLLRVSQGKGDGNANDPYSLRISSEPIPSP